MGICRCKEKKREKSRNMNLPESAAEILKFPFLPEIQMLDNNENKAKNVL